VSAAYPPHAHLHRLHLSVWLIAVVALAAALIGLASWVIVDQTSSPTTPAVKPVPALAPAKVVAMLDARFAALNSNAKRSFAQYYSPDTTFHDFGVTPPIEAKGRANVVSLMEGYSRMWALADARIARTSEVIQSGPFVANSLRLGDTRGIAVYELDEQGKIANQWAFGS
jgi:hypothetical protein